MRPGEKAIRFDPSEPPEPRGGISNFISWRRVEETLRATGELRPNERLTHFVLGDGGIQYFVKFADPPPKAQKE